MNPNPDTIEDIIRRHAETVALTGAMDMDDEDAVAKLQRMQDEAVKAERKAKDNAYWERNQLVAVLAQLYPAHLARHPESDTDWEDDWRNIVCVHLPTGQATWHIHDSDMGYFEFLLVQPEHWDGHTTAEKYQRLEALRTNKELSHDR